MSLIKHKNGSSYGGTALNNAVFIGYEEIMNDLLSHEASLWAINREDGVNILKSTTLEII